MFNLTLSIQEQNHGFLNVSSENHRPLHELFNTTTAPIPNWELPSRFISASTRRKEIAHQTNFFQKMKPGSQDKCSGPIEFNLGEDYCDALDDLKESTRIAFSKDRLVDSLTGGSCSAMAFEFADDYLRRRPFASAEEIIDEISPKYRLSSLAFRTIQAAFNTIHRDPVYPSYDFMRDKIGAMLRFYDRMISDSSELFYTESCTAEEDTDSLKKIESFLTQFEEGVFVIRCLAPKDNDKGEAYGHSTIFIKAAKGQYFYDPDKGIFRLTEGFEAEGLHQLVKKMMLRAAASFGRIYKIKQ